MSENTPRAVGDVVGGVHGGKYQFGTRGDAGFTGDAFAAALASSGTESAVESAADSEPWPRWATELRRPRGGAVAEAPVEEITTVDMTGGVATVRVRNVYRSWERFYASVVPADAAAAYSVEPSSGPLSPRGGANNVCDESKPYLDFADVTVRMRPGAAAVEGATLLVRTEEEQWVVRLEAQ